MYISLTENVVLQLWRNFLRFIRDIWNVSIMNNTELERKVNVQNYTFG